MADTTVKGYKSGTHRLTSPGDTLARVRPFFSKMGITRIANVTGLDTIGIPVVMVCRPNALSLSVSQGKGLDLDAAKVSGVMESVETYHAENILRPLKLASYRVMSASHLVVDVGQLQRAVDSYFHPDLRLLWIEGKDWVQSEDVWVPLQLVHTSYDRDMSFDLSCFEASTTGLASGNHMLEAVSHAICEIVERDAFYRVSQLPEDDWQDRRLDLATVDDPDCQDLLRRFDRAGVAVTVWDITSPVGIAAFQCSIVDRREDSSHPLMAASGMGCHPVRHIALSRALTEAAQSRLTAISGSRDDMHAGDYREWLNPGALERHRQLIGRPCRRVFAAVPTYESDSFDEDVAWEIARVRQAGADRVIVFDLTRDEFLLPVVRVLIPGMKHKREDRVPPVRAV